MSLKDSILQAKDCPVTAVEVPEWGLTVYVRTMTLGEMEVLQNFVDAAKGNTDTTAVAEMAAKIICDENGERVFGDDDADGLRGKSHKALTRIANAFTEVNGIDDETVNEAGNG